VINLRITHEWQMLTGMTAGGLNKCFGNGLILFTVTNRRIQTAPQTVTERLGDD
jgi:D-lyxose ketol-isomerase